MSLFVCGKCKTIENTALSPYWGDRCDGKTPRCSECGWGKWHGLWPKEKFNRWKWKYDESGQYVELTRPFEWWARLKWRFKRRKVAKENEIEVINIDKL